METKDKILQATIGFIKDNSSYEQLTLSKIALAANIGKSTVYEYFNNKEQLVEETCMFLLEQYQKIVFDNFNYINFNDAFTEQIKRLIYIVNDARVIADAIFSYHSDNLALFLTERIEKTIDVFHNQLDIRFNQIFELAIHEQIIASQHQDEYQPYVINAIITGLIYQYVYGKIDIGEYRLIELIKKQCLRVFT